MREFDDIELVRRAKEIFLAVEGLPPERREIAIDDSCGSNAELAKLVRALVEHADEPLPLERLGTEIRAHHESALERLSADDRRGADIGDHIGPYRLLERLGQGGFGIVFLAEQERPVRRKVALKIIKLGMDTREVVARFEAERQALALMDHPNIAKVFDAGATESGRPYFVMEFVPGEPITEFCDAHGLTIRDRARIVRTVCDALQHAHQKGVIHRDIKPGNVLVRMENGTPVPKVIDFGIAKATSARLTERTFFTERRQMIGTPEYMSPEQAGESSEDVDTRTDVYAIGVVLYELLVGVTPFDSQRLRAAAFGEMQRIIREEDPPRPSTRLAQLKGTRETIAARRRESSLRLPSTLRGELDWIVMKAIEKARHRRYESAAAMSADIARYLAGDAVLAAPPSAFYVVTKFMRRHRTLVASLSLVALALVAGLVGTSLALSRALRAENEERRLRSNAETAKEVEAALRAEADRQRDDAINRFYEANINAAAAALALHEPAAARRRLDLCPSELRGWEWRWLNASCDDATIICRHTGRVTHVAFHPEGRVLAARGVDRRMSTFELPSGRALRSFGSGDDRFGQVEFSPDGSLLAAGTQDSEVTIFDTETGAPRLVAPMPLHAYPITIAFSRDGRRLLCGGTAPELRTIEVDGGRVLESFPSKGILNRTQRGLRVAGMRNGAANDILDDEGTVLASYDAALGRPILFDDLGGSLLVSAGDSLNIVSAVDGSLVSQLDRPSVPGELQQFSPDGRLVGTLPRHGGVSIWDVRTGRRLALLDGHARPPTGFRFAGDGSMILTWSGDRAVIVWSLPEGRRLSTLFGHDGDIVGAFFVPGGARVASVSQDRTVRVHDIVTGAEVATWMGIERFVELCMQLPDNRFLLTGSDDGVARFWDLLSGPSPVILRSAHEYKSIPISTLPNGEERIGLVDETGVVRLFDPKTGAGTPIPVVLRGLSVSPDARLGIAIPNETPTFLDAQTGETLAEFPGCGVTHDFDRDCKRVAFLSSDGGILVYATRPFRPLAHVPHAGTGVHQIRLALDGRVVVASNDDGMVRVWDVASGACIATHNVSIPKHSPYVVELSPDERVLVTGGLLAPIRVIDLTTQRSVQVLTESGEPHRWVITAAFSADGSQFATACQDHQVRLWRTDDGALLATFDGHTGPAHGVAFHPTEARLASSGWDQTVRLWDIATRREVAVLSGHSAAVHAVRFSANGERLYSVSADLTVRVWDTVPKRQREAPRWENAAIDRWAGRRSPCSGSRQLFLRNAGFVLPRAAENR